MIKEGTEVQWNWGNGKGTGKVEEVFHHDVEKTIDGEKVSRKASKDYPSYLIIQSDGQRVIKSKSEIQRAD
ncbi:MAG: hypothetical protein CME64_12590 [Halobacteriovoraceae bacterium]|nr:hypothetical protein [Halobacteriovoraceae bacterium]|tara:strand:+ start:177666 stop:177878 length:213 start_codon:yes stop_codon:yes gene_type:complete